MYVFQYRSSVTNCQEQNEVEIETTEHVFRSGVTQAGQPLLLHTATSLSVL